MNYINADQINDLGLTIGNKYTLIDISEMMACCRKNLITITDIKKVDSYAQYNNIIAIGFKVGKKRNKSSLFLKYGMIFLNGWDNNLLIDSETGRFCGNALINFIGDAETIKQTLEADNAYRFTDYGLITYRGLEDRNENMLYLNAAEKIQQDHACIKTILKRSRGDLNE